MLMLLECCEPRTRVESCCFGELKRHEALGTLNDKINIESSGDAERQRRTKPNNSLNPTPRQQSFHVGPSDVD
jgi:hypothetical protein